MRGINGSPAVLGVAMMLLAHPFGPRVRGHIQRLCEHAGVLRLGGPEGAPYHWLTMVHYFSESEVELLGADKKLTPTDRRDIRDTLYRHGIQVAHVLRRRKGRKAHPRRLTR